MKDKKLMVLPEEVERIVENHEEICHALIDIYSRLNYITKLVGFEGWLNKKLENNEEFPKEALQVLTISDVERLVN